MIITYIGSVGTVVSKWPNNREKGTNTGQTLGSYLLNLRKHMTKSL